MRAILVVHSNTKICINNSNRKIVSAYMMMMMMIMVMLDDDEKKIYFKNFCFDFIQKFFISVSQNPIRWRIHFYFTNDYFWWFFSTLMMMMMERKFTRMNTWDDIQSSLDPIPFFLCINIYKFFFYSNFFFPFFLIVIVSHRSFVFSFFFLFFFQFFLCWNINLENQIQRARELEGERERGFGK